MKKRQAHNNGYTQSGFSLAEPPSVDSKGLQGAASVDRFSSGRQRHRHAVPLWT